MDGLLLCSVYGTIIRPRFVNLSRGLILFICDVVDIIGRFIKLHFSIEHARVVHLMMRFLV